MSGGVDSSVAVALLAQQGHDVLGLTMKLFDHDTAGNTARNIRGCCSIDAIHRAEAVCHKLNIPHYSIDLIDGFNEYIIEDFVSEYIFGRTPNPCVRCNTYLKWGLLFEKAQFLGCSHLATGHYARVQRFGKNDYRLLRAADRSKDQAYALWGISQNRLSRTLFPLGDLSKVRVREIAAELGLKTAYTPESQEICFIPEGHYADFLKQRQPGFFDTLGRGELVEIDDSQTHQVGWHDGYPFYTVGQRSGLGGGYDEPRYVLRVEGDFNRVFIGRRENLKERSFLVDQSNWLIQQPDQPLRADVQIRYRSPAYSATISPQGKEGPFRMRHYLVEFDDPVEAVTPGQSAVFFSGDRVLGGGRITEVLTNRPTTDARISVASASGEIP